MCISGSKLKHKENLSKYNREKKNPLSKPYMAKLKMLQAQFNIGCIYIVYLMTSEKFKCMIYLISTLEYNS
jgi:hypothetical protein